jgi:hypothetical protein
VHKASETQPKITHSHFKPTLAKRVTVFLSPLTCTLPIPTTVGFGGLIDCNCAKIFNAKAELSFFNRLLHCSRFFLQKITIAEQVKKSPVHWESRCVFCVNRGKAHSHWSRLQWMSWDYSRIHNIEKIMNLRVWRRGRGTGRKRPHDC